MNRHRQIRRSLSCVLFGSLLLGATVLASPVQAQPLKVGFIGGLSGPGKIYGEASKNGLEMAFDEIGREGVELVYEDDQFTPAKTVSAFKKLVEIDKVDLIIVLASSPSKAIAPLAEQRQIPLIAWASDTEVSKGKKYVFRSWISGDEEGARLAAEVEKRNYPSTAFLIVTSDYSRSVQSGFVSHAKIKPILTEEYGTDEKDFKPFLLKLKNKSVQHLGVCLNPGQSGILAKQAKDLGTPLQIFGCETLEDKAELKLSQGALLGAWFVTASVSERFHQSYLKKFGNDDVLSGAAVHYDVAHLLKQLANKEAKGPAILENIRTTKIQDGALGTYEIKSTPDDQYFDMSLQLKVTTATGFEKLK